ncbi:MAG TPA: hypothetical protein VF427_12850 [Noviherbaspirillum sp.]
MAREVDEDYKRLTDFLDDYNLTALLNEPPYRLSLKQGHAAYLALLTLWSAIQFNCAQRPIPVLDKTLTEDDHSFRFIQEAISDVGSSFFCCLHGAYKPGNMALRSAIENFVRSMTGLFNATALTATSVYELFDLAKTSRPFLATDGKIAIERLQKSYKELCKYTHSATLAHMAGIQSLDHFPTLDKDTFSDWAQEVKATTSSIISSFAASATGFYQSCHFRTKDILEPYISREQRLRLLGGA